MRLRIPGLLRTVAANNATTVFSGSKICGGGRHLPRLLTPLLFLLFAITARPQGFRSVASLAPMGIVKNTAEKPQSKVWHYDGKWWAVFSVADGTHIWRLDESSWVKVLKISSSTSVEADCKMNGDVCHIFLWRKENNPSQLVSVEYNDATKVYALWSKRSATVYLTLDSGVETGTIDIDKTGRMWLASDGRTDIRVRWSDPPFDTWSEPVAIAEGITEDDICGIISMPAQDQVGILWSDQHARRFGFKTHDDGSPPSSWSEDEMPAFQSALDVGKGMGDDHLNMAYGGDGTLYCAVKTGYDTPGFPRIGLLRRFPDGTWDSLHGVSETGTRAIVILNEAGQKLKIIYTSVEDGGDILYQESNTTDILFGPPITLIQGLFNNPTSSKSNYQSDIVILASDETRLVGVRATDGSALTVALEGSPAPSVGFAPTLYPNPVRDVLRLEFQAEHSEKLFLSISDVPGRAYFRHHTYATNQVIEIDVAKIPLSPGLYFLTIASRHHFQIIRFIKK